MEVVSLPAASKTNKERPARRSHSRQPKQKAEAKQKKTRTKRSWQVPSPGKLRAEMTAESKKTLDTPLLLITIMLLITGLISLLSASYPEGYYSSSDSIGPFYYFNRQLMMALIGLVLMTIVSCINYRKYFRWSRLLYLFALVLMVLVLTPLGTSLNNSQRWLFGFQPSEIAKLAIILTFASMASAKPKGVRTIKGLVPYVLLLGLYIGLLAMEPHMSAAMILVVIGFFILFVAGMRIWYLIPIGIAGVIITVISYFTLNHVQERFNIFLNPFLDAQDTGYQAVQSLIAIGSGGLFGLGLGQSRQKFLYLPEPMNDFIFSVICEELGFVGAALILVMFAYFVYRGFSIARRACDRFSCLLATGITVQLAFQILLNLAVVSGLFPVTGASLPLFSYGGTALVMQLIEIGILLNISRNIPPSKKQ